MNNSIYLIIFLILITDTFQYHVGLLPRQVTWVPDLLCLCVAVWVIYRVTITRRIIVVAKYIAFVLVFILIASVGIILNDASLVQLVSGIRVHLKHLPFFFLPAVYDLTELQIWRQLKFILAMLLLQFPVAIFEKFFTRMGRVTGDAVGGTLGFSGTLSIVLLCSIAITYSFYLKRLIGLRSMLLICLCLFLPTTLNETKITVVLLPLALIVPILMCHESDSGLKWKKIFGAVSIGLLLMAIFVPIYNYFIAETKEGVSIEEFLGNSKRIEQYLYLKSKAKRGDEVARGDQIVIVFKLLSKDIDDLLFGRGIGYTTESYLEAKNRMRQEKLGTNYKGAIQYRTSGMTILILLWEIGLFGLIIYLVGFIMVFHDAKFLSKSDNVRGALALGWCAVVIMLGVCLMYQNTLRPNPLNLVFWYISGTLAVEAFKERIFDRELSRNIFNAPGRPEIPGTG